MSLLDESIDEFALKLLSSVYRYNKKNVIALLGSISTGGGGGAIDCSWAGLPKQ